MPLTGGGSDGPWGLRADLLLFADAAHLPLRATARDTGLKGIGAFRKLTDAGTWPDFAFFAAHLADIPGYGVHHMLRTTTLLATITLLGLPLAVMAVARRRGNRAAA